jgi:hypothetical protein
MGICHHILLSFVGLKTDRSPFKDPIKCLENKVSENAGPETQNHHADEGQQQTAIPDQGKPWTALACRALQEEGLNQHIPRKPRQSVILYRPRFNVQIGCWIYETDRTAFIMSVNEPNSVDYSDMI